jgi:hypothetical protein
MAEVPGERPQARHAEAEAMRAFAEQRRVVFKG